MLRISALQQCFKMPDPQAKDSRHERAAMRHFAGIDIGNEAAADATMICELRHLIGHNGLNRSMLTAVMIIGNPRAILAPHVAVKWQGEAHPCHIGDLGQSA
jgi:hypothetical protein